MFSQLPRYVSKVSSPDELWHQTTLESLERAPRMPAPSILIVGENLGGSRDVRLPYVQSAQCDEASSVFPDGSVNFEYESPV